MTEYRVNSGKVRHRGEYYGPGDTFTADLSDRQVAAMEISPVDGDADGGTAQADAADSDSAAESAATDTESDDDTDASSDGDDDTDTDADAPDPLTTDWVENADYPDLRSVAGRFDDVNGNWGEDRLRTELLEKVDTESEG